MVGYGFNCGGLERMKLDLGHRLDHNEARSRPLSQTVDDCEIPLPLSCLINNGGSGFGDFIVMGLLTKR